MGLTLYIFVCIFNKLCYEICLQNATLSPSPSRFLVGHRALCFK